MSFKKVKFKKIYYISIKNNKKVVLFQLEIIKKNIYIFLNINIFLNNECCLIKELAWMAVNIIYIYVIFYIGKGK